MAGKVGRPKIGGRTLFIRVPDDLHHKIHRAAGDDKRTMSEWVRLAITELFERKESRGESGAVAAKRGKAGVRGSANRRGNRANRRAADT